MKASQIQMIKGTLETIIRHTNNLENLIDGNGPYRQCKAIQRAIQTNVDTLAERLALSSNKTHRRIGIDLKAKTANFRITVIEDLYNLQGDLYDAFFTIFPNESGHRSF